MEKNILIPALNPEMARDTINHNPSDLATNSFAGPRNNADTVKIFQTDYSYF